MEKKAIWKSKTVWVNVLSVVAIILGAPQEIGLSPERAAMLLAVVNVILRVLTTQAVSVTGGQS